MKEKKSSCTDKTIIFRLNAFPPAKDGPVIYWMGREQRLDDNPGFFHALELASTSGGGVEVVFCFSPKLYVNTSRNISFMIGGLKEVAARASELSVPFRVLWGDSPAILLSDYAGKIRASAVVCDFNPLREFIKENVLLARNLEIAVTEVDSHNIVPCRFVSSKQEFGAHTLRKKIERLLPQYLEGFPEPEELIREYGIIPSKGEPFDWQEIVDYLKPDASVEPPEGVAPGYTAGMKLLDNFISNGLSGYAADRNNPNLSAQSGLSPYLHHGNISSRTAAAMAAMRLGGIPLKGGFLDELVVRKELADNFCLYNPDYDSFKGFPNWARHSLGLHSLDQREVIYAADELEKARTHDPLWNAAQLQLVKQGKVHGYMRMYWAKKILEWSKNPEAAMRTAVYLNDRYSLDGHDPNGYAGCAWAIGGVHDRAWAERPVFGKIRYMNYNGCRRKFDVEGYIASVETS